MKKSGIILISSLLVACGGGSVDNEGVGGGTSPNTTTDTTVNTDTTQKSFTVVPSLSKISNATVTLYNALTLQQLSQKPLDKGVAVFSVPANTPALLIEVTPAASATYFDTAVGTNQPLSTDTKLRAVVTGVNSDGARIGVTPLTEAAVQRAEALGGLTLNNIAYANQAVGAIFNQPNILQAPTLLGSLADFSNISYDDAGRYTLLLVGLAMAARNNLGDSGTVQPTLKMSRSLAADLADGRLDKQGINMPFVVPYQVLNFADDLNTGLKTSLSNLLFNNGVNLSTSGQTLLNQLTLSVNPVPTISPVTGANSLCATQKALSMTDLSSYVGSYSVDMNVNSAGTISKVKTSTLQVLAEGSLQLDGVKASIVALCQLKDSLQANIGVSAFVTNGAQVSSVQIAQDKTIFGNDFTQNNPFRFISTSTLTAPAKGKLATSGLPADLGVIFDPTPAVYGDISITNEVIVNVDATQITWNALTILELLADRPFRTIRQSLHFKQTAAGALTTLAFSYAATNVSGITQGTYILADSCISTSAGCLPANVGVTVNTTTKEVTFNKVKFTDGKNTVILLGTITY